jgi:hypothetical protein
MNKPKYKLGDIIYDISCDRTELIISINHFCTSFWYKTIILDGYYDGKHDGWCEDTLDNWCEVIGNVLEDENDCSC